MSAATQGKLADNVVLFAQLLRRAGLVIGSGQVMDAVRALGLVEVSSRVDVMAALHCTLVTSRRDRELFDQAFDLFWRNPFATSEALALLLPKAKVPAPPKPARRRRVQEAWREQRPAPAVQPASEPTAVDLVMSYAPTEVSRTKDFEEMSVAEIRAARRIIERMSLAMKPLRTRRWEASGRGPGIDMRRTLRAGVRWGADIIPLRFRRPRRRPPAIVAICDISGSMERYSRLLLVFLHALSSARERVSSFVFGTRLHNVSRTLRERDVDRALARLGRDVGDWSGGTRIGACLRRFNRDWSRRVLAQGAVVLLITDGLDRDPSIDLGFEADRLRRSCRRLIWLNPLLRFAGFEPRARGIVQLLPHVDEHRPVHNLHSLEQLAHALR